MYKIIALIGEAGTGKDTLMRHILKERPMAFNEIISCTTRPKREGEVEGINYFYLTHKEFTEKILNCEMLEATSFNNWFYGTSYESLRSDCLNIGVFNPDGIRAIQDNPVVDVQVFKITCSDKKRLLRQLNREIEPDVDEIIRRHKADKEDFFDLEFPYIEIRNEFTEDIEHAVNKIIDYASLMIKGKNK